MKNYKTYNALKIAKYFLKLGKKDETLTPQKLIKIVIIANGHYLDFTKGTPLITELCQAWKYGDVIVSLYERYRSYRNNKITEQIEKQDLNKNVKNFLKHIWEKYGEYDGMQLSTFLRQYKKSAYNRAWNRAINSNGDINLNIPNIYYQEYFEFLRN